MPHSSTTFASRVESILDAKGNCPHTDLSVIGNILQPCDAGAPFVTGRDNYVWLWLVAREFRPRVIVEMGTRFGYSLKAFVLGANHRVGEYRLHVFDDERDSPGSNKVVRGYFSPNEWSISFANADTRDLDTLGLDGAADLAFVDAYHTSAGCFHECNLGWESLKPGGVLVVDDVNDPDVSDGLRTFCTLRKTEAHRLPSLNGLALLEKR